MIIFDLDGTLANCEHRRHFVDKGNLTKWEHSNEGDYYTEGLNGAKVKWKPDWQAFYEACDQDKPIEPAIELFKRLWDSYEVPLQIWSGRSESVRNKTDDWLTNQGLPCGSILKMRPISDSTPDDQLKEKWLDEVLKRGGKIDFVFDDRSKVVRMWRRRGIFVFDVNQTGKEF